MLNKIRTKNMINDDFLEDIVYYGLVLRGSMEDIRRLKQIVSDELPNLRVVYQRPSFDRLLIFNARASGSSTNDE